MTGRKGGDAGDRMIFFRADANRFIGTGHVMRCLALAKEFLYRDMEVCFITADREGDVLLDQNDVRHFCLDTDWKHMEAELPVLLEQIFPFDEKILIVDSYQVTSGYLKKLREVCRLAYFDDMDVQCWPVDVLINYNIFAPAMDYSSYSGTELLLGTSYVPLRREFRDCPKRTGETVKNVLISAGGADPERITWKLMNCFAASEKWRNIEFHYIVGALNPEISAIRALSEKLENSFLHINEKHMADLMIKCDLAVAAAGSTLYELCACGVPTVCYTLADNQTVAGETFASQGIMLNAGDCRIGSGFILRVERLLASLADDPALRKKMSGKMQRLADGLGTSRLADALLKYYQ